jgi:hypothetical protein
MYLLGLGGLLVEGVAPGAVAASAVGAPSIFDSIKSCSSN